MDQHILLQHMPYQMDNQHLFCIHIDNIVREDFLPIQKDIDILVCGMLSHIKLLCRKDPTTRRDSDIDAVYMLGYQDNQCRAHILRLESLYKTKSHLLHILEGIHISRDGY
jgi:hypothetical protein